MYVHRLLRLALAGLCLLCAGMVRADDPILLPQPSIPASAAAADDADAAAAADTTAVTRIDTSLAPAAAHGRALGGAAWHQRFDEYFRRNWGLEVVGMHTTASGWMLKFEYRILDAAKAALLNEKRARAFVIDEATDVRLAVPAMENIGELRQTPSPEEGRVYYILFGNPGHLVKQGGRVDIVVGRFRADGLMVE